MSLKRGGAVLRRDETKAEKLRREMRPNYSLSIKDDELKDDIQMWKLNMRMLMPSMSELDENIQGLPAYIPSEHLTKEQLHSLSKHNPYSMNIGFLNIPPEDSGPGVQWFSQRFSRFLYEIIVGEYLALVERKQLIDFKVAIDNTLDPSQVLEPDVPEMASDSPPPCSHLDNYVGNWVKHISQDDDIFCNPENTPTPIVRRAWILGFNTAVLSATPPFDREVSSQVMGHQILIVAEKRRENPSQVTLYVIDNVPSIMYKHFIHLWIDNALRHYFSTLMPQLNVVDINGIVNALPTSVTIGTCMSVSFRALMLFSFMHDPLPFIIWGTNSEQEGVRFMKLLYLQMCRMRYSLLTNTFLWEEGREKYIKITAAKGSPLRDPPHRITHNLHNIRGLCVWMYDAVLTKEKPKIKGKIIEFNDMFHRIVHLFSRSDEVGLMDDKMRKTLQHISSHIKRLFFNRDLNGPISSVFQEQRNDRPCTLSAHFNMGYDGLY